MTGRQLIIYILTNNLEDKELFKDGKFLDFLTVDEVAVKFKVGRAVIKTWNDLGLLEGFEIGDSIFFPKDVADPRKTVK